jgi:hypothetical protein
MMGWMCGVSLRDSRSSIELNECLEIEGVAEVVRRGRLQWFGNNGAVEKTGCHVVESMRLLVPRAMV